jgi:lyso-ornithine lipid O-acyltransferase
LIGPFGRVNILLRLAAMLAWLICCIALYYVWQVLRRRNPWPRIFLGGVAWLSGVDIRVEGPRAARGTLFIANHVSWIDIPAIAGATGTAFVAHDGLSGVPFVHWLCRMNDTVFVARHDRTSVTQQIEQVRQAIHDAGALTIFPEGTTSDGTGLLPFKSSLLAAVDPLPAGMAVQPVWLDYGAEGADIAWIGSEPGLDNFLRVLARWRPIALTVHFLPPLSGEALTNRKTIAAAAREAILTATPAADARTAR